MTQRTKGPTIIGMEKRVDFKPRRSLRTARVLIAVIGAFLVFGLIMFFWTDPRFGLTMALISAVMMGVILIETARIGWLYSLDPSGIYIKRTFKRYHLAAELISEVKLIDWKHAKRVVDEAQLGLAGTTAGSQGGNVKGSVKTQIEIGRLIGFSSIPFNVSQKRFSKPGTKSDAAAHSQAKFILVHRTDGRRYLLSPQDTAGFLKTCRKFGIGKK